MTVLASVPDKVEMCLQENLVDCGGLAYAQTGNGITDMYLCLYCLSFVIFKNVHIMLHFKCFLALRNNKLTRLILE